MAVDDEEATLDLYMAVMFSTPFWGVHFRVGSTPLMTLCGMTFDDNGKCLQPGKFSADEVITRADNDAPLSCPQCLDVIDELGQLPVDLMRAAATMNRLSEAMAAGRTETRQSLVTEEELEMLRADALAQKRKRTH